MNLNWICCLNISFLVLSSISTSASSRLIFIKLSIIKLNLLLFSRKNLIITCFSSLFLLFTHKVRNRCLRFCRGIFNCLEILYYCLGSFITNIIFRRFCRCLNMVSITFLNWLFSRSFISFLDLSSWWRVSL